MAQAKPFIGHGLGQFKRVYALHAVPGQDATMDHVQRPFSAHQFLADSAVAFGWPWVLAGLTLFVMFCRKLPNLMQVAIFAQFVMALATNTFLNPVLWFWLIVLVPKRFYETAIRKCLVVLVLIVSVLLWVSWLPVSMRLGAWLHPTQALAQASNVGDYQRMMTYSRLAYLRDPAGPNECYNLGLAALNLAESPDDAYGQLGVCALAVTLKRVPRHQLAAHRLDELATDPFWQASSTYFLSLELDGLSSRLHELVLARAYSQEN